MTQSARPPQSKLPAATRAARQRELAILRSRIGHLWLAFLRGQLVLMLVVGVVIWLGLAALGVRWALLLGIVAGLLEVVPRLGPTLATIPAVLVALWRGSCYLPIRNEILALLVLVFYVLVQLLESYLIAPRVMGDALKLPALVVLLGVAVGAWAAGVPGALLATPLIGTARELWRYYRAKRRGLDPFPHEKAQTKGLTR